MTNFSEILGTLLKGLQDIEIITTLVNVLLAGFMSFLIYLVYVKYGISLSNRKHFGGSFLLITVCTCLIIALIKSSIALSLGLVGALSIIRFRTAIKEPQELTYIFFCIAMGLGFGANERLLTLSSGLLVLIILILIGIFKKKNIEEVYNITVRTRKLGVNEIVSIVSQNCSRADLRRFDRDEKSLTALLFVEFDSYSWLEKCIAAMEEADEKIVVSFVAVRSIN